MKNNGVGRVVSKKNHEGNDEKLKNIPAYRN